MTSSPPFVPKLFLLRSNKQIFFTPGSCSYHQVLKIGTFFCIVQTFITFLASQTTFPPELWVLRVNKSLVSSFIYFRRTILSSRRTISNCCSQTNHYRETKLRKNKHLKLISVKDNITIASTKGHELYT